VPTHSNTDTIGQVHDPRGALVAALGHDVGRAELAGKPLSHGVPAHRDDSLCAHLPGREHAEQTNRTITDDHDGRAGLHVGRIGGCPSIPSHH